MVKVEQSEYILSHPAYKYALDVVSGKSPAGEYIVKECKKFLKDLDNEDSKYFLNEDDLKLIDEFLKLVKMSDGHRVGMTAYDSLAPFQWYFLANTLAWKYKENPNKRRYQKSVLLIGRKNGKILPGYMETYICNRRKSGKVFTLKPFHVNINLKTY